jgi:hypothetical protein
MPALIPLIVSSLMTVLRVLLLSKIGSFIVAALLFLGLSLAIDNYAIDPLLAQLRNYVAQLGAGGGAMATAMQWAGVLNFDKACSVLLSAYTTAWTIKSAKVFLTKAV